MESDAEPVNLDSAINLQPTETHNHATIHELPTELLIRVFYAATEFRYSHLTLIEAVDMLLSISRVSRYWRAVILSIPKIWGRLINVSQFSAGQVNCFMSRSRGSPIELFLDGESRSQSTSLRLRGRTDRVSTVLSELWRISYLVIRRFHLTADQYDQLCQSSPSLQIFSFEGDGPDPVRLPMRLFNNDAPHLRSLRLSAAVIDLSQVSYPNLTELTVRDIRAPFAPSIGTWLIFLSNNPSLTSLHISYAISVRFSDTYEWLPTVNLSHLENLTIADDAMPCAHILSKINVPSKCNFSLRADFDGNSGLQLLHSTLSKFMSTQLHHDLKITLSGISVAFSNAILDVPPITPPSFFFKFQWQSRFEFFDDFRLPKEFFDFLPRVYLSKVEHLRLTFSSVDGRYIFDDPALLDMLGGWLEDMTSVKHLIFDSSTMGELLDLLSDDGGGSDEEYNALGEDSSGLIFPSLQELEILSTQGEELDWEALVSFVEWRDDVRHRIKSATIPQVELDHLNWKDGSVLAELGVAINLK